MQFEVNIQGLERNLAQGDKIELLTKLIMNADRGWFEHSLREFKVEGRTRIYKDFAWGWRSFEERDRLEEVRLRHVTQLIQNNTISEWVNNYILQYPLRQFLLLFSSVTNGANINFTAERVRN